MAQNWKKLGQIFVPDNENPYLLSHAANPLPVQIDQDVYRVFYCGRNEEQKSSVGCVDIDIERREVVRYPKEPLVTYGPAGTFASHGISIGNVYQSNGIDYILFMAWQNPPNAHWRGDIGRLQLTDKEKLEIHPNEPFLGVDEEDAVSLSYPWVMYHEGQYKMWYGSTLTWEAGNGEMLHVLKYATSQDGQVWERHGLAVPYEIGVAQAFSRPTVIIDDNGYHMWYSYRSGQGIPYRIGYARSKDGRSWERLEQQSGITVSENGWDSQMVCYPFVFDHAGKRYMMYNGNSHGKTGIGLAVLESD